MVILFWFSKEPKAKYKSELEIFKLTLICQEVKLSLSLSNSKIFDDVAVMFSLKGINPPKFFQRQKAYHPVLRVGRYQLKLW